MGFQKQVNPEPGRGVPGQVYGHNPVKHYFPTPQAGEGGVIIGRFVWLDAGNPTMVINEGAGLPLGIARRERALPLFSPAAATMLIPAGMRVPVVQAGDIILASEAPVAAGQKIFAHLETGEALAADAGDEVDGAVETAFTAKEDAAAGEPFLAGA